MKKFLLPIITLLFITSVHAQIKKREMRAVWIATVANIDWPSSPNLTSAEQRNEMRTMLDSLEKARINTIIIQIRPTADAFYPSQLEPWSNWLTGQQGVAPSDYYDPLKFIIREAHKRCMEVHVWLNPYRVLNSDDLSILSKNHIYFKHKEMVVEYGGKYYFDPGLDETREFLNKVVQDIVERYDIDAVHFDDYFYPYKVNGKDFPDDQTFKDNPRGFSPDQKDDWRRNNINMVISELHNTIKSLKPWVQFGISPFGVWRNASTDSLGSATSASIQDYDDLYADILKWLKEGTIDYVVPQLYWEIGKKVADYSVLVKWWSENSYGRNLYIGHYVSQLGSQSAAPAWRNGNEIMRQMRLNEKYSNIEGDAFFSAKTFLQNRLGLLDSLQNTFYKYPAICPAVNGSNIGDTPAQPQNLRTLKDGHYRYLVWDEVNEDGGCAVAYYVVYAFKGNKVGDLNNPANIIATTTDNCIDLNELGVKIRGKYTFVVTAINRYRRESIPTYAVTRRM